MIQFVWDRAKTCFYVPEAFSIGKLSKCHRKMADYKRYSLAVRLVLFFVCIALVLYLRSSHRAKYSIVGKWQIPNTENVIEFFKDGTVNMVEDSTIMRGEYEFLTHNYVQIHFTGLGVFSRYTVSASKNVL